MHKVLAAYSSLLFLQIPIIGGFFGGQFLGSLFFGFLDASFLALAILQSLNKRLDLRIHYSAILLMVIFTLAPFTLLYSTTPDMNYTLMLFSRDIMRVTTISLICGLITHNDEFELMFVRAIKLTIQIYIVVAGLTMSYEYDYLGSSGRLMYGTYRDSNGVAHSISLIILVAFYFLTKGYRLQVHLFGLAILLFLVFSKTSIAALIVSIFVSYYVRGRKIISIIKYLLIFAAILFVLILLKWDYLNSYLFKVQGGAALLTLSGRTLIWEIALENIPNSLLFGHGMNSFVTFSKILENNPGQVHNEFLQILFAYGLIGLSMFGFVIMYIISYTRKLDRFPLILSIIIFYSLAGITEASLTTSIIPLWIILMLIGTSRDRSTSQCKTI